ncbi:hypothetical protein QL093DRAFT_2146929 [Fusarium oxysporum]|nr:hypothetical protein QL093DRAFT_2146929 [Fusarium oxysporum]
MEQFSEFGGGPGEEEVMSHPVQHPPRKSSLEPLVPTLSGQMQGLHISTSSPPAETPNNTGVEDLGPPVPPKDGVHGTPPRPKIERNMSVASPSSPAQSHRPPPPEPEPEPTQPFDFHGFSSNCETRRQILWQGTSSLSSLSLANDNGWSGGMYLTRSSITLRPNRFLGRSRSARAVIFLLAPAGEAQHQEDVERDDIVRQKMSIYGWVREEHLDIPPVGDSGQLLKIKSYRAPRDKIICVLNCCKVIFGLLKHNKSDSSADSFMPLLIYVVLQSNPEHLVSNVQYILRFRNQEKLGGEAGYYLSSLMGAVQFIENMDRTTLTITDEEFEKHVEEAVSAIAEKHAQSPPVTQQPVFNEKSGPLPGETSARPSLDGPRTSTSNDEYTGEEKAAITGLLKTIQKPLSSIGRMFSDDPGPSMDPGPSSAPRTPAPPSVTAHALSAEEAAARQASAEAAEAQRLSRAEHANVVETLAGMFPDLDKDVISDVVYEKEGRVGLAVDACLALST